MVGDFKEDESVTIEQLADSLVSFQYNPMSSRCLFFPSSQCLTLGSRKEETWMPAEMTVDNAENFVIPIESALKALLSIEVSAEDARKIRNGQEITLNNLCDLKNYDICYTIMGNLPIAICSFIYGCIKPIRVFNI